MRDMFAKQETPLSACSSECITQGIRIHVQSFWLPEHSSIQQKKWAFSYTVTITNEGLQAATLLSRHWAIADSNNLVEHVRGPGVVGHQPQLQSGQSFTYSSGALLRTPHGTMQGEYTMERENGERFEAIIAPFALATPESLN